MYWRQLFFQIIILLFIEIIQLLELWTWNFFVYQSSIVNVSVIGWYWMDHTNDLENQLNVNDMLAWVNISHLVSWHFEQSGLWLMIRNHSFDRCWYIWNSKYLPRILWSSYITQVAQLCSWLSYTQIIRSTTFLRPFMPSSCSWNPRKEKLLLKFGSNSSNTHLESLTLCSHHESLFIFIFFFPTFLFSLQQHPLPLARRTKIKCWIVLYFHQSLLFLRGMLLSFNCLCKVISSLKFVFSSLVHKHW